LVGWSSFPVEVMVIVHHIGWRFGGTWGARVWSRSSRSGFQGYGVCPRSFAFVYVDPAHPFSCSFFGQCPITYIMFNRKLLNGLDKRSEWPVYNSERAKRVANETDISVIVAWLLIQSSSSSA
jgi:hypothetical protein